MKSVRVAISLKEDFYDKVKAKAKSQGMGISEYIRYALIRLWESEGNK